MIISLKDSYKIKCFDEIASNYYNRNFGMLSKSDIDLLMFKLYYEKLLSDNRNEDGTLDYKSCSDYKISKDLGITESRVRSLKVRYQLKYGEYTWSWEKEFAKLIDNARYDKDTHKVSVNIPDPNLYIEIQNYLERIGGYVEKQLNSKILQLRAEYFLELAVKAESEESRKRIIKKLKEQFDESEDAQNRLERDIGKTLLSKATDISSIAAGILSLISSENIIGKAIIGFLQKQ